MIIPYARDNLVHTEIEICGKILGIKFSFSLSKNEFSK